MARTKPDLLIINHGMPNKTKTEASNQSQNMVISEGKKKRDYAVFVKCGFLFIFNDVRVIGIIE